MCVCLCLPSIHDRAWHAASSECLYTEWMGRWGEGNQAGETSKRERREKQGDGSLKPVVKERSVDTPQRLLVLTAQERGLRPTCPPPLPADSSPCRELKWQHRLARLERRAYARPILGRERRLHSSEMSGTPQIRIPPKGKAASKVGLRRERGLPLLGAQVSCLFGEEAISPPSSPGGRGSPPGQPFRASEQSVLGASSASRTEL